MLPRIANLDNEFHDAFTSYVQVLARRSPILREIKSHVIHEGDTNTIERSATDSEQTTMLAASAETKMSFAEIETIDANYILAKANELAAQFEDYLSKHLFKTMNEVTTKTGQTINAAGKPLTNELIMEMFSKMQMDFEKSPNGDVTIVTAPGMLPAFEKLEREHMENPAVQKLWDDMMEKKRDEFREREINRNMVG